MTNKSPLPEGYEGVPAGTSRYMKLLAGDNKFRLLSDIITGYEYWNAENKPVRSKQYPTELINPKIRDGEEEKPKHFWAMTVWDYTDESVKILEITQVTILRTIENYISESDLGNPTGYDIKIIREGEKKETKYTVMALPPKELTDEQKEGAKEEINLSALYTGDDPFNSGKEKAETEDKVATDEDDIPF